MAQKNVNLDIILNGRIGSGVNGLVDRIQQIGQLINGVSTKVQEWEEKSVETYKNYETYMLEAKAAMASNYDSTTKLERDYNALWSQSQKWAATTIFHTNDVSQAIAEAAHAGWDYEKMLQGIPAAMLLAQAGNIDLSSGLDYLIKTLNGTGMAFEDSNQLVDQWVTAANSSATTVSELGEALLRMGATARLGDSNAELLTLLATLADAGTTGQQAGTLLRNGMIRLIAPTDKANAALQVLGATTEEIEEALSDKSVVKAAKELEDLGVSAYDTTTGELRPMIDVFRDLYTATKDLTDERKFELLSAIFPTRTITGALTILEAMEHIDELYDKISNSDGAAQNAADIMMSGLMGSQETFLSKWEEFERKFGETISEPLKSLYELAGGIVDKLNALDEPTMSALAGAMTNLAAAGPVMLGASGIVKAVGLLGIKGTLLVGAVVGVGALYGYLTKMNELALEENFGTMAIDMEAVNTALANTQTKLSTEFNGFAKYSAAVKQAVTDYTDAGTYLAENLWSTMVTGQEFNPDDPNDPTTTKLKAYGENMIKSVKDGIELATAEKMEFISLLFKQEGGDNSDEGLAENPVYSSLISLISVGYDNAKTEAERLSQELRSAMTSAFADGKLTDEELQNIQSILDQMDQLMSGLNPSDVEKNQLWIKSRRVSLDSMREFSAEVSEAAEKNLGQLDDEMLNLEATLLTYYNWALQHGQKFVDPLTRELVNPAEVDIEALIDATEKQYQQKRAETASDYNDLMMRAWRTALLSSDTGELFSDAENLMRYVQMGIIDPYGGGNEIMLLNGKQGLLRQSLEEFAKFYDPEGGENAKRGWEYIAQMAAQYRSMEGEANQARADWFERMYIMGTFGNISPEAFAGMTTANTTASRGLYSIVADLFSTYRRRENQQAAFDYYNGLDDETRAFIDNNIEQIKKQYDLQGVVSDVENVDELSPKAREWLAAYRLAIRPGDFEQYKITPEAKYERAMSEAQDAVAKQYAYIQSLQEKQGDIAKEIDERQARMEKRDYGLLDANGYHNDWTAINGNGGLSEQQIEVDAEIEAAMAELEKLQKELDDLSKHPPVSVDAEAKLDSTAVDNWIPPNKYAWVYYDAVDGTGDGDGKAGFAFGGRATEASIFGEAGPEWAIPEEHSQRTAYLLNQARQASGFSWSELLSQYGGLNAGRTISVNVGSYAPVIHAADAAGVEQKLIEDKARLSDVVRSAVRKALDEMGLRDEVEVYA